MKDIANAVAVLACAVHVLLCRESDDGAQHGRANNMEEKLTIQVHGQVIGHRYEDESVEQASARLLLAAEMEGNNGHARLHLNAVDPSLTEIFNDGIIRNDAPQDVVLSRGTDSTIADKIATINHLVAEVCEYKRGILNAYREGDLDFDTAVGLLKAPDLSRYERALIFAARAHGNQRRKYTNEPYLNHPIAVAGMLADAGLDEDVVIAGALHDCIEDTSIVYGDIRREFGAHVADLVLAVTDIMKPGDGSRIVRKTKYREHLATMSAEVHSLKCADIIHNIPSIVEHDPKFAKIYLAEKRALLAVLTRAEPNLLRRAWEVLEAGEKTNLRDLV